MKFQHYVVLPEVGWPFLFQCNDFVIGNTSSTVTKKNKIKTGSRENKNVQTYTKTFPNAPSPMHLLTSKLSFPTFKIEFGFNGRTLLTIIHVGTLSFKNV